MPVALVTGGAQRVGRAIALALADAGFDVVVHYGRSAEKAEETAHDIEARGRRAATLQLDLAALQPGETPALDAPLGPPSLLVNSASTFKDDRMGALSRDSWDAHFATNLRAPIVLAEALAAALPASLANGEASIVNILDQRVLKPNPQFFSYGLSKAALHDATRMMAQALAPRIRVNAVAPGPTLASVHQSAEEFAREVEATLLGRGSPPEEIAAAVVYLARAVAITGQTIAVDGGQHLAWKTPDILAD